MYADATNFPLLHAKYWFLSRGTQATTDNKFSISTIGFSHINANEYRFFVSRSLSKLLWLE